jgi:hypothetical protein
MVERILAQLISQFPELAVCGSLGQVAREILQVEDCLHAKSAEVLQQSKRGSGHPVYGHGVPHSGQSSRHGPLEHGYCQLRGDRQQQGHYPIFLHCLDHNDRME